VDLVTVPDGAGQVADGVLLAAHDLNPPGLEAQGREDRMPSGGPSRTTKTGCSIRLRGRPSSPTVVTVQNTVSRTMRTKSSSSSENGLPLEAMAA
jgi:hypothetical protein